MDELVTKRDFAITLGISVEAVTKWDLSRDFRKQCYTGDKISLKKACRFLYDWKQEEANRDSGDASEVKKFWDGQKSKVQYLQMVGELIPKTPHLQAERERLILLKSGVMSLADQLAPELNLTPDQKKLIIQKCRALLHNLKETFKERESEWIEQINSKLEIAEESK